MNRLTMLDIDPFSMAESYARVRNTDYLIKQQKVVKKTYAEDDGRYYPESEIGNLLANIIKFVWKAIVNFVKYIGYAIKYLFQDNKIIEKIIKAILSFMEEDMVVHRLARPISIVDNSDTLNKISTLNERFTNRVNDIKQLTKTDTISYMREENKYIKILNTMYQLIPNEFKDKPKYNLIDKYDIDNININEIKTRLEKIVKVYSTKYDKYYKLNLKEWQNIRTITVSYNNDARDHFFALRNTLEQLQNLYNIYLEFLEIFESKGKELEPIVKRKLGAKTITKNEEISINLMDKFLSTLIKDIKISSDMLSSIKEQLVESILTLSDVLNK